MDFEISYANFLQVLIFRERANKQPEKIKKKHLPLRHRQPNTKRFRLKYTPQWNRLAEPHGRRSDEIPTAEHAHIAEIVSNESHSRRHPTRKFLLKFSFFFFLFNVYHFINNTRSSGDSVTSMNSYYATQEFPNHLHVLITVYIVYVTRLKFADKRLSTS